MMRKGSLRIHPGTAHVIFHAHRSRRLRHARRAHAGCPRRHRLRPARVDAHARLLKMRYSLCTPVLVTILLDHDRLAHRLRHHCRARPSRGGHPYSIYAVSPATSVRSMLLAAGSLALPSRVAGIRIRHRGPAKKFRRVARASSWPTTFPISTRPRSSRIFPGRTVVFLKRSLLKLPILGYAFKLGQLYSGRPRRQRRKRAARRAEAAQHVLASGLHITTFVEGMRSPDGRMLPFKKGPFYLAKDSGAPCIPVSIYGSEKILP